MSCGLSKEQRDQFEQLFYSFDTDKDGGSVECNFAPYSDTSMLTILPQAVRQSSFSKESYMVEPYSHEIMVIRARHIHGYIAVQLYGHEYRITSYIARYSWLYSHDTSGYLAVTYILFKLQHYNRSSHCNVFKSFQRSNNNGGVEHGDEIIGTAASFRRGPERNDW